MTRKLVLWFGDHPYQVYQAHRFHQKFEIAGVVFERKPRRVPRLSIRRLLEKLLSRLLAYPLHAGWIQLLSQYRELCPGYPNIPTLFVENVNSPEVQDFTRQQQADLVLVSGTGMVREPLVSFPCELGIMNLHTGLSPYINGGPSCTNWCLATGDLHLIGNTVMWLDAGIDSGKIIATATVDFTGKENLAAIQRKVFDSGQDLYERCVEAVLAGISCPGVPQETLGVEGRTYFTREWGLLNQLRALWNWLHFHQGIHSADYLKKKASLRLVDAPEVSADSCLA
ncbi:MAG: hypothetical protein KIS61_10205 [Candidatus Eremiobacteraeota bacterium]|nr:hypothetical protein [Candidatus Eremiobacteraeota bacterium]